MVRSVHFPGMTLGEMDTYLDDADNLSTYGTYVKVEEDKMNGVAELDTSNTGIVNINADTIAEVKGETLLGAGGSLFPHIGA